jgi:hypothetical protein
MIVRMSTESISNGYGATADYRPPPGRGDSDASVEQQGQGKFGAKPRQEAAQPHPPTKPPPAPPSGAAFAVALINGQLAPRPTSERELIMRLGSADPPAQRSVVLHDRRV